MVRLRCPAVAVAVAVALGLAGCGDETSENGKDGNRGNGAPAFQGDPALDGLKPGDCLKYPELEACQQLGVGG